MQNRPEINHCSPNLKAYWCAACKAHNTFDIKIDVDQNGDTRLIYRCKACRCKMFKPADFSRRGQLLRFGSVFSFIIAYICSYYGGSRTSNLVVLGGILLGVFSAVPA